MINAWSKVQKDYSLEHIKFEDYFKNIGRPFFDILKIIGVKKDYEKVLKTYQRESINQSRHSKFYKNALKTLMLLRKKNFILNIVTSKDMKRTKIFLGKNINLFSNIQCLNKKIAGKPDPYQINKIIKKSKVRKKDCVYIGDTNIDYLTAMNAKIDFIYAEWGYGKNFRYKYRSKNISDILKILEFNKLD
tara:strand:- start:6674 stop:7243 length:570 start_codon:yes stop_codon:yes gene_type:complete